MCRQLEETVSAASRVPNIASLGLKARARLGQTCLTRNYDHLAVSNRLLAMLLLFLVQQARDYRAYRAKAIPTCTVTIEGAKCASYAHILMIV